MIKSYQIGLVCYLKLFNFCIFSIACMNPRFQKHNFAHKIEKMIFIKPNCCFRRWKNQPAQKCEYSFGNSAIGNPVVSSPALLCWIPPCPGPCLSCINAQSLFDDHSNNFPIVYTLAAWVWVCQYFWLRCMKSSHYFKKPIFQYFLIVVLCGPSMSYIECIHAMFLAFFTNLF